MLRRVMMRVCLAVALLLASAQAAQAARPVARWDVVPDQVIRRTFNAGVCAFHIDGVRVEFRVNGTLVLTANDPTYNPRTGLWEFVLPLNPAGYSDGLVTLDARAIAADAGATSYDLPSLRLYANSGGSLTVSTVKWADAVNGSDSNAGTEAAPYLTLAKAVKNTPSGGTIYLKPGSYSSDALGGGSSRPYWTTISAAPGVDREVVEVGRGRPGTQRLKWTNLTLFADYTGGYYTILNGENGSHSVWVDNCTMWNKKGRWAASAQAFGNNYVSYVTGGLTTEMCNGPGGSIVRGHDMLRITSDAWSGGGRLVANCSVTDINRGSTTAHPDFHQSYTGDPDGWVSNVILYNVRGYECISQGLFGSQLRDAAFVNVLFEKYNTVMYSQYSGPMENVLYLQMDIIYQTWLWRATYVGTDVMCVNNIYNTMSPESGSNTAGVTLDTNHFVGSSTMGTHVTTGAAGWIDAAANNYRIADTSPAWGTGRHLQCVPADIDGNPFDASARNRGAYAKTGSADDVFLWQIAANHGPAGEVRCDVADGAVHSAATAVTAIRAFTRRALDPTSLARGWITLVGQAHGDQTALIQSFALEDDDTTLLVNLSGPLPDADRYTLTVTGSVRTAGGDPLGGDTALEFAVLAGDVDGSGQVADADVLGARGHAGAALTADTARFDVDASGSITGADLAAIRSRLGHALP